jgi:putative chitinase
MSFEFDFKKSHLVTLIPSNKNIDVWYNALIEILPKYNITTRRRVSHFISQCAHESQDFRILEENLNYSENALKAVFSRYFGTPPKRNAAEYARKPEKIANYVYQDEFRSLSGKMGNIKPGDGWLFRGRGLKQLTGRNNYSAFGKSIGVSAEEATLYVATEKGAIESATWFWDTHNLNNIADTDNVVLMTKRINGGNIGIIDRQRRYEKAMEILGESVSLPIYHDDEDDVEIAEYGVLRRGSRGGGVMLMQKALGIVSDGIFGPGTERKLKNWQSLNSLTADGIAGPKTLEKLLG